MFRLAITIALLWFTVSVNAQYNFESCYAFWELTDKMKSGVEPSEEEWRSLKETEGYDRRNISDDYWNDFRKLATLVFLPNNEKELAKQIENDMRLKWIVRYAEEEKELKAFARQIEIGNIGLMDSALHYVRKYLPEKYLNCFPIPTIYFSLLDYDANGTELGVNMDLLVSYDVSQFKTAILAAHELFHYVVDKCKIKRLKEFLPQHKAVINAFERISEEGTADLIDKPWMVFNQKSSYMHKNLILDIYQTQSAESIKKINTTLEALADQRSEQFSTDSYWQDLTPFYGHIPGMYMGRVIKKNGFEEELIGSIYSPFNFFYLYNKAAKRDSELRPTFSDKAIDYIKLLEKNYIVE